MQAQFTAAINQICDEKNLSKDVVMETVKAALASAYKKDYGSRDQEVRVEIDEETGAIQVYVSKEVVKEVEDKTMQITLEDAKKVKKTAKVGDTVEILDIPADFGRIAAQTAKQVIIQRIREAEREIVFEEFKDKEGELVGGVVQRVEGDTVIVDLGKSTGVLYRSEQIGSEHYYTGQRLKFYIVRVESSARGPQVVLSRSHPDMIKKLFEMEVPEILAGTIEIKSIAREAGDRSKIAVTTQEATIDPVGALVGQRGSRVQSVMSEIGEEKIDIILWDEDDKVFITNALSPAKVLDITLDEKEKRAVIKVPEDQLSLAIGKRGQNVRLAAKLTGWNVDIAGADESGVEATEKQAVPETKKTADLEEEIIKNIESQGEVEGEEAKTETDSAGDIAAEENSDSSAKEAEAKGSNDTKEAEAVTEPAKPEEEATIEPETQASKEERELVEDIEGLSEIKSETPAEEAQKSDAIKDVKVEKAGDDEESIEEILDEEGK